MAYAHSANRQGTRHDLCAHLRAVSELAAEFAQPLGAAETARSLGLWHDLGKFHPEFQRYLLESEAGVRGRRRGPDHKAAGARFALGQGAGAVAMIIQGHHGGLQSPTDLKNWLAERGSEVEAALARARQALPDLAEPGPLPLPPDVLRDPLAAELFLRLLFSALVDADYLDTEAHFAATAPGRGSEATIAQLWAVLERAQAAFSGRRHDDVERARHAIYQACLQAAERPPGLFRLTVPTGGGKTRSAMAFALRHAVLHGQERVIVGIPFISITEQTADVYREILESDPDSPRAVLEHHSAAVAAEGEGEDEDDWARLAAENWDAPVVVTTTVQLFESLFAASPSKARRVHRLANSVLILDEAQALPAHLLAPMLDVLRQLAARYNTSVVFSTATQPAFEAIPAFGGLAAAEIVPQPERFFQALKRVSYEWRTELGWDEVAAIMAGERQALAVVNTKRDALALLDALDDPQALHLSTLLCGAHRRQVIAEVKRRLAAGEACRLVSTQVVEAGVDLDFPVVLRALGPLDSIIQAAGRCNREGRLAVGRVIVFAPADGGLPGGIYRTATGVTQALLGEGSVDLHGTAAPARYFSRLFNTVQTDRERIQEWRRKLHFGEVARLFRMIDDDTESVVVRYGAGEEVGRMLEALRTRASGARLVLRRLQPYLVGVRRRQAERYRRAGLIAPVLPGLGEWMGSYDPVRGLTGDDPDPDSLVV